MDTYIRFLFLGKIMWFLDVIIFPLSYTLRIDMQKYFLTVAKSSFEMRFRLFSYLMSRFNWNVQYDYVDQILTVNLWSGGFWILASDTSILLFSIHHV